MRRALALLIASGAGCASTPAWKEAPHDRVYQRVPPPVLHPCPPSRGDLSEWWLGFSRAGVEPLAEALSPRTWIEAAIEGPEAEDVNAFGQVVGSPWFTPRLGARTMSVEAVARGPANRPPAIGPLKVTDGKLAGVTPGMIVEDVDGGRFVVKFDPPAFPEMSSSAEIISSRILHAAGWFVPENYLYDVHLDTLVLEPGATTRGHYNKEVPLTKEGLRALISNVNPRRDGTVRAMLSRFVPGRVLGPGSFRERHYDDPNETLAPTDRRSLRGLGLFYAWLNNVDSLDTTTLATWQPSELDSAVGHIEHYLIDFGDSLGASGPRAKFPGEGYEYRIDWPGIGSQFFSLGFYYHYWLPVRRAPFRAVGFYESEVFEPGKWRPTVSNPAFDAATRRDRYWAASLIARFTPAMLAAVVEEARYTEPGAAQYVIETLRLRQEKILRWAFAPLLPLDDPRVAGPLLAMTDLAAHAGVVDSGTRRLSWRAYWDRSPDSSQLLTAGEIGDSREIAVDLGPAIQRLRLASSKFERDPFITVRFVDPVRPDIGVDVHLRVDGERVIAVGLDRDLE